MNQHCTYEPRLNGSPAFQHFKHDNVVEIRIKCLILPRTATYAIVCVKMTACVLDTAAVPCFHGDETLSSAQAEMEQVQTMN